MASQTVAVQTMRYLPVASIAVGTASNPVSWGAFGYSLAVLSLASGGCIKFRNMFLNLWRCPACIKVMFRLVQVISRHRGQAEPCLPQNL
jgi:hypothetical protein